MPNFEHVFRGDITYRDMMACPFGCKVKKNKEICAMNGCQKTAVFFDLVQDRVRANEGLQCAQPQPLRCVNVFY